MERIAVVGIDLGKRTFHLHAQDARGQEVLRRKTSRTQLITFLANLPPCQVVMEACGGAHWLARRAQELGHDVKLIAPQYVKPFVKGMKHDFADAQAICEAASRPSMRFAGIKSAEQQTLSMLHRVRESLVRERTAVINQIHAFLLEFGVSLPVGHASIKRLAVMLDDPQWGLPPSLKQLLQRWQEHYRSLDQQVGELERELRRRVMQDETAQRLLAIPGIGPITASALTAEAGTTRQFACGRDFAASLGLVPRQHSTGGKPKLLGISKRGDAHLRRLLVQGARAVMRRTDHRHDALARWTQTLLARRHSNIVACALANKMARIVWAVLARNTTYRPQPLAT